MTVGTEKPVRLVDVARKAGVSRVAVARVLLGTGGVHVRVSDKTSQKIQRIAQRLGYRPNIMAQQLKGKRSGVIGVIIDSYAAQVQFESLSIMERQAAQQGYRFMVGQSHGEFERIAGYADDFVARGVDGVICISHGYPDKGKQIAQLFSRLPNVVFINRPAIEDAHYVAVDTADGVRQSVEHLLQTGRQRIALMLSDRLYLSMQERRRGYLETLAAHGRPVDERRIWVAEQPQPTPELLDSMIDDLLVRQKVDAIQATNDIWAVRLMKRLLARGIRVPDDVAIVGYDNLELAELSQPELTSIDQNVPQVSRLAVEMLLHLIEDHPADENAERSRLVRPRLVVRQST